MGAGDRAVGRAGRRAGGAALSGPLAAGGRPPDRCGARPLSIRRRAAARRGLRIPRLRPVFVAPIVALALAGAAGPLAGQLLLLTRCQQPADAAARTLCVSLAQQALIAQARFALAAAGGNPLPGSSSTLGMRIGSTPRVAVQLRGTGAHASGVGNSLYKSVDADVAVGILSGASPAATLGGVGSLDLLGSIGYMPSVTADGDAATGAIGLRLGVMRESFTTPGITLSGVYRRIGSTSVGIDNTARLDHIDDLSLRAVVGKRLLAVGTSAGVGWDHTSSNARIAMLPTSPSGTPTQVSGSLSQGRLNAFADLTWISLVFSGTVELGWQAGGSPAVAPTPTGHEGEVRKGGLFGSVALRLTI